VLGRVAHRLPAGRRLAYASPAADVELAVASASTAVAAVAAVAVVAAAGNCSVTVASGSPGAAVAAAVSESPGAAALETAVSNLPTAGRVQATWRPACGLGPWIPRIPPRLSSPTVTRQGEAPPWCAANAAAGMTNALATRALMWTRRRRPQLNRVGANSTTTAAAWKMATSMPVEWTRVARGPIAAHRRQRWPVVFWQWRQQLQRWGLGCTPHRWHLGNPLSRCAQGCLASCSQSAGWRAAPLASCP